MTYDTAPKTWEPIKLAAALAIHGEPDYLVCAAAQMIRDQEDELTAIRSINADLLAVCKAAEKFLQHDYRNRTITASSPVLAIINQLAVVIARAKQNQGGEGLTI